MAEQDDGDELATSHGFVLQLVEAGLLAGAAAVDIEIGTESIEFCYRRDPPLALSRQALEQLVSIPNGASPELGVIPRAGMIQLARGVLTALRSSATRVSIQGAQDQGDILHVERGLNQELVPAVEGCPCLRVKVTGCKAPMCARKLLERRCHWAPTPISVNGDSISRTPMVDGPLVDQQPVSLRGEVVGQAGLYADGRWGQIRVFSSGLLIESFSSRNYGRGVWAHIDVPLPRDPLRFKLVRGDELDEALAGVDAACNALPRPEPTPRQAAIGSAGAQLFGVSYPLVAIAIFIASAATAAIFHSARAGILAWVALRGALACAKLLSERNRNKR